MATSRKENTESAYYADFENRPGDVPAGFKGLGYYSRTSIEDVVNNFIVAYTGDGKIISKVPKYEVEFWAQRGVQEFSYDILHSDKSIEIELGEARQFPLPQDFVSYQQLSVIARDGTKIKLFPTKEISNPTAILQDGEFKYVYDTDGGLQEAAQSTLVNRFQGSSDGTQGAQEYYNTNFNQDNFSYYNARYGSNPADMSSGGSFFIDKSKGVIFFDGSFVGPDYAIVVLDYISDGLANNGDLSAVYIPKMAEDAMYSFILYNLCKLRPSAGGAVALYKKEASSKMRNAKIRLTDYKSDEMTQVLRGKSKWIKH
jgi:hypothetical protein